MPVYQWSGPGVTKLSLGEFGVESPGRIVHTRRFGQGTQMYQVVVHWRAIGFPGIELE